jgi:NAD(P)-dependent dehydrogenase (short-subunit alcohol dehydrogenase family)
METSSQTKPVVLITGALTGIGRATAIAFSREGGAHVVVSGRHEDAGKTLEAELRAFGGEAEFIQADVRREDEVRNLVDKTVERFGRLDVAINNAGTEGKIGPITEQSTDSYAATFDTNVLGVLLSMKHQYFVHLWANRSARRITLCREQARGRRTDQVGGTGGCAIRSPCERGRSGSY